MNERVTDDTRISDIEEVIVPESIIKEIPISEKISNLVFDTRDTISKIIRGTDDRLLLVVGPCSIHDPEAAIDYAKMLVEKRKEFLGQLEIIMRVYFEKPRTTVGWKGLINDPGLDNSFDINRGLRLGRELLNEINSLSMPAGVEFLDVISPQYLADLVSWGAIGARTTESQVHRELASGLSCPVGFKNGTSGDTKIALDAVRASNHAHHFLSVTKSGRSAIVKTTGNHDCHVILRGGKTPNYDTETVSQLVESLRDNDVPGNKVMIDASHGNSNKKPENQLLVCKDICTRVANGNKDIFGVMVESNLVGGRQDLVTGKGLEGLIYGKSITDACISWQETDTLFTEFSNAIKEFRKR